MKTRLLRLISLCLLLALLAACSPDFPTDRFVRTDGSISQSIIFYTDGRWESFTDGNLVSYGQYRVSGDQVHFESDYECEDQGFRTLADYHWISDGSQLTFTAAGDDACPARSARLTGIAYQKTQ